MLQAHQTAVAHLILTDFFSLYLSQTIKASRRTLPFLFNTVSGCFYPHWVVMISYSLPNVKRRNKHFSCISFSCAAFAQFTVSLWSPVRSSKRTQTKHRDGLGVGVGGGGTGLLPDWRLHAVLPPFKGPDPLSDSVLRSHRLPRVTSGADQWCRSWKSFGQCVVRVHVGVLHERFSSDTRHCPTVQSKCVCSSSPTATVCFVPLSHDTAWQWIRAFAPPPPPSRSHLPLWPWR